MTSNSPYVAKWGILATGGIAETFCSDLLADTSARGVSDVKHKIVAVASSTSAERAAAFIQKINGPSSAKTYGSYTELVNDPNVDIIYVATPHSHHFQNAMLALEAGKHVLCEKALTVTAEQTRKLVAKAKESNLFLMEAVWTRFFPGSIKIREMISDGVIGNVHRTIADLSINESTSDGGLRFDSSSRMINKDLAGGALLDLGIYALTWVFQTLYHVQPEAEKEAPKVLASINQYSTGVDESTSIICQFPKHRSMGVAMTSMLIGTDPDKHNSGGPAIRIQGTLGEIAVMGPAYRPQAYKLIKKDGGGKVEVVNFEIPKDPKTGIGHGMFWEADECARCLRDGKQQSDVMPWSESIVIMEVMEETLRQGKVEYPEVITTDIFDANSPLNTGKK